MSDSSVTVTDFNGGILITQTPNSGRQSNASIIEVTADELDGFIRGLQKAVDEQERMNKL